MKTALQIFVIALAITMVALTLIPVDVVIEEESLAQEEDLTLFKKGDCVKGFMLEYPGISFFYKIDRVDEEELMYFVKGKVEQSYFYFDENIKVPTKYLESQFSIEEDRNHCEAMASYLAPKNN